MIFGDPFEFAIQYDVVDEWNEDFFWVNGIYNIYIKGRKYPIDVYVTELRFALANFLSNVIESLSPISSDIDILNNLSQVEHHGFELSSSDLNDIGVFIYFIFDLNFDYIIINDNGKLIKERYGKGYIFHIITALSKSVNTIISK